MTSSLKIIFAGTPLFAAMALEILLQSKHHITAVYTQPDRPAGRGLKLSSSPVKQLALLHHLPLYQPASLKTEEARVTLARLCADVMVVAAYGLILPKAILDAPRLGCINIHPSLLPRWRGAAPIQRTIFAGDKESGVSIMQMDEGLDTGPLLSQKTCLLSPDETSATLHDKLAVMGGDMMVETLDLLANSQIHAVPQNQEGIIYANKIDKQEAKINWAHGAQQLEQAVRAFNPFPIMHTLWHNQLLRIWMAKAVDQTHHVLPGAVLKANREGIDVATGNGVLRLLELQLSGGKALPIADFYLAKKHQIAVGDMLQ